MREPPSSNILGISTLPAHAGPRFAPPTPYRHSPCPLRPVKVQLLPQHLRGLRAPLELRPNSVLTDDRAVAGDAAGRLSSPTGFPPAWGPPKPPFPPIPRVRTPPERRPLRLAFAPPPSTPHPPAQAAPSSGRRCTAQQVSDRIPGMPVRSPAASAAAFGPQSPDPRVPPGFPGGGVGTRGAERTDLEVQRHLPGRRCWPAARSPRGGRGGGRRQSPSGPRGPCAARRSFPLSSPVCVASSF